MALDQATRTFLAGIAAAGGPPLHEMPLADVRTLVRTLHQQLGGQPTEVANVREEPLPVDGGAIPIRMYWPRADAERPLPIIIHYHGGGWAAGDLDSHDVTARYLCRHADAWVIHVGYRLAPEHKFPVAVEDSYAALKWVVDYGRPFGDPTRIAVVGDSAGGNLAAAVCQLAKARGGPSIVFQALLYPALDLDLTAGYRSRAEFGGGEFFLSNADMKWFADLYLRSAADAQDPLASPLRARDLTGLPPALIVTAGNDVLRDEGKAYADRLAAAGVPVEYRCFESTIHAFMSFGAAIPVASEALAFVAARIKQALATSQPT